MNLTTLGILAIFYLHYAFDCLGTKISKSILKTDNLHYNTRWFFVHFLSNLLVTTIGLPDFLDCLNNTGTCYDDRMTTYSKWSFWVTNMCHLYHILFYFKHMKKPDWIHHLVMFGLCGPLGYISNRKLASVAAWFMTGYPGMIDYFLLWLVKLKKINPRFEKLMYIYISLLIRSPGCLFVIFLSIPGLINFNNIKELLLHLTALLFVFWNGQYYLAITIRDAAKKGIL